MPIDATNPTGTGETTPMATNYSEAEMRALIAAQVASGLVTGLSLGAKSPDERIAELAETAVRIATAIHNASVKSVQIR